MPAERHGPVHWPSLQPENTVEQWTALRSWLEQLVERFPLSARVIPPCWYRHNYIVEALSALRDCERSSFDPACSPAVAFDFLRAVREAEGLLAEWTSRSGCTVGEHHPTPVRASVIDTENDWESTVEADLAYRRALAAEVDEVLDYG